VSLRRAARITKLARLRFINAALLKHLNVSLLCHHGAAAFLGDSWLTRWL
jgi:hypothetical protein